MSRKKQAFLQLAVVLIGLLLACIVIMVCSKTPLEALRYFLTGPFSSVYNFGNLLSYSVPLIIEGLASALVFSASVWNLGIEGQMFFGMLCGTFTACQLSQAPAAVGIILSVAAAFAGGGAAAWVSAWIDRKFSVNIMLSTLLISNALSYIVMYFLEGPFNDPRSASGTCSPKLSTRFMLAKIMGNSDLHTGIFIALACVVLVWWFLHYHRKGFEIIMTGQNRRFAEYSGIKVDSIIALALFLSGGLAGLGGMVDILGVHGKMRCMMTGFGWDGVSIAMIARNDPLLVLPIAFIFAFLEKGVESAALFSDVSPAVAQMIQAVILFFATAQFLFRRKRAAGKKAAPEGRTS